MKASLSIVLVVAAVLFLAGVARCENSSLPTSQDSHANRAGVSAASTSQPLEQYHYSWTRPGFGAVLIIAIIRWSRRIGAGWHRFNNHAAPSPRPQRMFGEWYMKDDAK